MGRVGGFMDFERKEPGYRKKSERVKDFKAVEKQLPEAEIRAQAARCMDCGTPFCHGCGCPLSNIIPEVNHMVYKGRWKEALELILSTNNFPEFTGRLCPALCEPACVLGINSEPVTVRQIEIALIEKAYEKGYMLPRPPRNRNKCSVAVVGSGPAGLAVADELNHAGCNVTVYESHKSIGGVLRYGIPDFKLEKSVIDRRVKLMEAEGVQFECGVHVGDDVSCKYLLDRFDAVCLSGGSRIPRDLNVPGREFKGIHFAMDYLVQQNMRVSGEGIGDMEEISAKGKKVLILGGGDTGADCVGTAVRQGAESIHQYEIMPRPPEERTESAPWPEWPNTLRKSSSHEEGGERRWCINTKAFKGKKGIITAVDAVEIEWVREDDGRMSMQEVSGSAFELPVDLVLLAMGFVGPGKNSLVEGLGLELDERGNVKTFENNMTSMKGVFAAGDLSVGQSLIVRAIFHGRETARGILKYLNK